MHIEEVTNVPVVLGIDAAWTERGSSAIALLRTGDHQHHIIGVAPSYIGFVTLAERSLVQWHKPPSGTPDIPRLLDAAKRLAGSPVDVVAIDMPMSKSAITGYRTADRELSKRFGAAQAATHTPNAMRPGSHGKRITDDFTDAGFHLATVRTRATPSLIEVFPLAALVQLMHLPKRPEYKVTKTSRYWPNLPITKRMTRLLDRWRDIEHALRIEVGDLGFVRPSVSNSLASLKPYEDALDAVICALVGACFVDGAAEPFGDDEAAIWVPNASLEARLAT
jgi:predicted RNase H-like nuclease